MWKCSTGRVAPSLIWTSTNLNPYRPANLHFTEHDAIASADVTGDGFPEIIVAENVSDRINIFNQFGRLIARFPADFNEGNRLAVGDIDGDGRAEILSRPSKLAQY